MGKKHTAEFRQEAIRLAQTSGLTRREIASDLGVGLSTLGKWAANAQEAEAVNRNASEGGGETADLHAELNRLRRENKILKEGEAC